MAVKAANSDVTDADRLPKLAAVGAVAAGFASISCCVLPLIFVAIGVSGAWIANLTALSPYQPLFIVGALGAISFGFWRARLASHACATREACENPMSQRLVGSALWTGLALVILAVSINVIAPFLIQQGVDP
jgi:mercuric ion transport protein